MAFKFQVIRKMRGTGVALLEVNDPDVVAVSDHSLLLVDGNRNSLK